MKKVKTLVCIIPTLTIALTFFGCGNLIPYSMQPSYHEFKNMCELNLLPNNKEKYNKILNYFNLSLDTLDWDYIQKQAHFNDYGSYLYKIKKDKGRISASIFIVFKNNNAIKTNIDYIWAYVKWDNKRKYLDRESIGSYNLVLKSDFESCTI